MKLKDWAEKTGVKYLTAYRWFKDGTLPVPAYQTKTGTIIVEDSEATKTNTDQSEETVSMFLKKTLEFSKSNASVEDFAAYVLSNFSLQPNTSASIQEKLNSINSIVTTTTTSDLSKYNNFYGQSFTTTALTNPDLTQYGTLTSNSIGLTGSLADNASLTENFSSSYFTNSGIVGSVNPTQSDIEKAHEVLDKMKDELQSVIKNKRGRKPTKK